MCIWTSGCIQKRNYVTAVVPFSYQQKKQMPLVNRTFEKRKSRAMQVEKQIALRDKRKERKHESRNGI